MGRPRPWLAATLAALHPGLGHVYLREWLRASMWFLFAVAAGLLVVPPDAFAGIRLSDPATLFETFGTVAVELSTLGLVLLGLVVGCNVADAYNSAHRHAMDRARAAGESAALCPHCGQELDEELDFCHWCTTRLDDQSDGAASA